MDKITVTKAQEEILDILERLSEPYHLQSFVDNMKKLNGDMECTTFDWWSTYLAWSEMGTEEDMDIFYG